jgi:spermidine synthase
MQTYLQRIGKFEIISFVIGFALMAFELVAARLLAPTIGSSVYVWTSVIGVIIAALSIGYAIGGKIADARVKPLDVVWLLLLSSMMVIITSLLASSMLEVIVQVLPDSRAQGVVASLFLFAPTSFLLGVVSPYLVRLRVSSAKTSGESVALLSALNSIGGITGTFLTGFFFFSVVGSIQALVIVSALLMGASWLIIAREDKARRMFFSAILIVVAIVSLLPSTKPMLVAAIDTPSATYQVLEGGINNDPVRVLVTGPTGYQSGVYGDGRKDLVFFYTKKMAEVVAQAPNKKRILILGGGAFTLPQYLAEKYPDSHIDTVEIDPKLEGIAKRYFGYMAPKNSRVIASDARAFLNHNTNKYDIILADVYSDSSIPFSLTTREYAARINHALESDGIVAANFVAGYSKSCAPLLEGLNAAYVSILPYSVIFPDRDPSLKERQNMIVVYSRDTMRWLSRNGATRAHIAHATPFTDNFAPVENLGRRCR